MTAFPLTHPRTRPVFVAGLASALAVIAVSYQFGPPADPKGATVMIILASLATAALGYMVYVYYSPPYYLAFENADGPDDGQYCVYLLTRPDGMTKIGYTGSFPRRQSAIRAAAGADLYPLGFALVDSEHEARGLESELHECFAAVRHHGEWFDLRVKDLALAFRKFRALQYPSGLGARGSVRLVDLLNGVRTNAQ